MCVGGGGGQKGAVSLVSPHLLRTLDLIFVPLPSPKKLPKAQFSGLIIIIIAFWLHHVAFKTLVPRPGIEQEPLALEAEGLNHWTAREVPLLG